MRGECSQATRAVLLRKPQGWREGTGNLGLVDVLQAEGRLKNVPLRRFEPGNLLLRPESRSGDVLLITSGRVRVYFLTAAGEEAFIDELGPGECVGELAAIDGSDPLKHFEAIQPTRAFALRRPDFLELLDRSPGFANAIRNTLCSSIRRINRRYIETRLLPMRTRLCAELLRLGHLQEDGSVLVDPAPTHLELAKRIASQRETVTKELNRLGRSGAVESSRSTVRLLKPAEMQREISNVLGIELVVSPDRGSHDMEEPCARMQPAGLTS